MKITFFVFITLSRYSFLTNSMLANSGRYRAAYDGINASGNLTRFKTG